MKLSDFSGILPVDGAQLGGIAVSGISSDFAENRGWCAVFRAAWKQNRRCRFCSRRHQARRRRDCRFAGEPFAGDLRVPLIEVDDARRALALSAARFFVSQPETMVAVTGTSGKTSVASFVRQIWEQAGFAAASIGTTGVIAPGRNEYGSLTTPDPVALHGLLAELAKSGVTHAAMEASSHGLDQRRLDGVRLAAGAFTNLGRDHMDYHPTVDHYHHSKLRLFDTLLDKGAPAVVFADDAWSEPTVEAARAAGLNVLHRRTARFVPATEAGRA